MVFSGETVYFLRVFDYNFLKHRKREVVLMKKLVFINACIRGQDSRTLSVAQPILAALEARYAITRIDLTGSSLAPVTAPLFDQRGSGISPEDSAYGKLVAEADRIVIAAPFWDMSFPSVLKVFFEHISVPDITFRNNPDGTTRGNCKAEKLLYITTRGMEIETGSALDQGTSYLKALGWLWGFGEVITVAARGMDVQPAEIVQQRLEDARREGLEICKGF